MTGANNSNAFRRAAAHTTAGKVVDRGTLTGITASRNIRYTGTDFFLDSNHRRAGTGTSLVVGSHHADDPLAFRHVLPDILIRRSGKLGKQSTATVKTDLGYIAILARHIGGDTKYTVEPLAGSVIVTFGLRSTKE